MKGTPVWSREKAEAEKASDLRILRDDDPETWARLVTLTRDLFGRQGGDRLREKIAKDDEWWLHIHIGAGAGFRNQLRDAGFNEAELGIVNLDNVYVELLEAVASEGDPNG